jgi:hypothetical protein
MIHALTVTGNGTTQTIAALAIASTNYTAFQANGFRPSLLQIVCEGPGVARVGDINTTASYGSPVPGVSSASPGSQFFPSVTQVAHTYSLTSIYVYIPSGTVVSFLWDA